ncbi:phage holin family protein [Sphingomonas sp. 3-13AW]|uniref:phage holin family protein n=1 Tax=Sphingomonas sp. 3-13AW TaxID=3050450 RepID=UPI003BB695D0
MRDSSRSDASVGELVQRLVGDSKAWVQAELAVWKAVAASRKNDAILGLALGIGALVIAFAAIGALLVGLILVLRGPLGNGGATAVVVIGALAIAGILGKIAATRLGRAFSGDGL